MAVNQVLPPGVAVGDVVLLKKIPDWLLSEPVQSLGASGQKVVWDGLQGAKRSHSWGYGEALQRSTDRPNPHFLASRAETLNRLLNASLEEFFRFMHYIGHKSLVTEIDPYGYYWLGFGSTQQGPEGAIYTGDSFCVTGDCIQKCADREAIPAWLFLGPGFS